MQRRRVRPRRVTAMRLLLTIAVGTVFLVSLLAVHVSPSFSYSSSASPGAYKLPKVAASPSSFLLIVDVLQTKAAPGESRGYLLVSTNGGLNQMRAGISDMVAVVRIINATLVIPKLDKSSFWQDSRENTPYWKVKDIDPMQQRSKAGGIYGGDSHMADLQSRFPILMSKVVDVPLQEKLAWAEEIDPFRPYASQMAALDYIVSVESDVFVPSYLGNMARAVEGHRRFLGHRKTITPDR
ncbi:hypothetical protein B296_00022288 [Ensete ventricosum]|uniref:O-fucosyltransferase family protein n=1 Tax=Ensete ventricosum TaxID=4639 RepID=A0A426ZJU0_ENSVE|nr:hypothetical protein B296_00022288 [Ensete ventricosum]